MENNPSQNSSLTKNKRIASNTLMLFLRMFVLTLVNLYSVRIVLKGLGAEDYGIFNTVAGVVTTTTFLSSVLAMSIQRFYSVALGNANNKALNNIFTASLNIIIVLSILVIVIFESVGLWFLNTQLTIPEYRMSAARIVYHLSLLTFISSLYQIPYTASIFAHEDMGVYALISAIECGLKLLVALSIGLFFADNMQFYGIGLFAVSLIITLCYRQYAARNYQECHYKKFSDRLLYRQLLSFSGWALYGSLASVGIIQGNTILLNIFFGPLVIVSFTLALQINNAFNSLSNSIVLAFRPAMIRAYAEKQFSYLNNLFTVSNKSLIFLLLTIAIPLVMEMPLVLSLWLGNVSGQTVLFARLMIVYIICMAMNNPISIIMHASGKIRQYNLPVESITLLCVPVTWGLFKLGLPPHSVFYSIIGLCVLAHIVRMFCLRRYYSHFSIRAYITSIIMPSIIITVITGGASYLLHSGIPNTWIRISAVTLLTPLLLAVIAYFYGINKEERELLTSLYRTFLHRK